MRRQVAVPLDKGLSNNLFDKDAQWLLAKRD